MSRYFVLIALAYLLFTSLSCDMGDTTSARYLGSPSVTAGLAVAVSSDSAIFTGTVNPNGLATVCHLEYDTTLAYRLKTPDQSVGQGVRPQSVNITIANLYSGSIYYYRLVATNASGTSSAENQPFKTQRHFTFPLAIGNSWTYQYYYSPGPFSEVRGVHIWKVTGAEGIGSWRMMDIRQDTSTYGAYPPTFSFDSVYFAVTIGSDSILVTFPESLQWFGDSSCDIPVSFTSNSDTLVVFRTGGPNYEKAEYRSRIGLISYHGRGGTTMTGKESILTLIDHNFP